MADPGAGLSPLSEADYRQLLEKFRRDAEAAQPAAAPPGMQASQRRLHLQQVETILQCGVFDRDYYLATYADIRAADIDPLLHYIMHSDEEGRSPNLIFDPRFYRAQLSSVQTEGVTALYHYLAVGEIAGLSASAAFNARRYVDSNPELASWLTRPMTHYLWLGRPNSLSANHRTKLSPDEKVEFSPRPALPKVSTRLRRAVNVVGPLDRVSGLAVSVRSYLDGLSLAGFGGLGSRVLVREFERQKSIGGRPHFPTFIPDAAINLFHVNGDALPVMLPEDRDGVLDGKYNIAVWYWEMSTLRPEWPNLIKRFHEFWAPTEFIAAAIRQSTAKPVRLIPPYLSYLRKLKPTERNGPPNFLYCFDANSILERKNPVALLDAFQQAFTAGDDVTLTFKITYPNRTEPDVERLYVAAEQNRRIRIVDTLLSEAELSALMSSATAYVSPHRSEGLGLTVVDAMAMELPVIATPWGGIGQFVTPEAAYPIDYRLVELTADHNPYPKGFVWADPDIDSLARLLRAVLADPAAAQARARVGRQRILQHFAAPTVVETYRSELERIAAGLSLAE